jgi:hypothetical protein
VTRFFSEIPKSLLHHRREEGPADGHQQLPGIDLTNLLLSLWDKFSFSNFGQSSNPTKSIKKLMIIKE